MRHSSRVFVIDQGKVLLFHRLKEGRNYYTVPGGGIEPGETPEQAAIRELKEETNLNVMLGEKTGELETDTSHEYFYISQSWSGALALGGEELEKQSPTNVYELEWVPIEKPNEIDLGEKHREILLRYLSPASRFQEHLPL